MTKSIFQNSTNTAEAQTLTDWLKAAREESGHTLRTVSKAAGTTHSIVGKIETRERRLDVVEFVRYCKILGIDPIEGIKQIV